jgi:predicted N-acyltransferase
MAMTERKWGGGYLTREFFELLQQRLADRVVLVLARQGKRYVAGALNLMGSDTLYGRNWGVIGDFPFLHFEVCYYRALDFAISRGLKRVEAGAQGEHKIQRGYLPVPTYSAHWIRDPGFARAVASFLDRERKAVAAEMTMLEDEMSPFRQEAT